MKVIPFVKKTQYDVTLNEKLVKTVLEEVAQDAREKKEKIEKLENAILKKRSSLVRLNKHKVMLEALIAKKERRLSEAKTSIEHDQAEELTNQS